MKKLLATLLALTLFVFNSNASFAEDQIKELPECVVITHCVRVNWEVSDIDASFNKAVEAVANTPRTKIIAKNDAYIHAEARTKWMRYIDDLEIKKIPNKNFLQVRSESRIGIGDNGVNQKRVNALADRLIMHQILQ